MHKGKWCYSTNGEDFDGYLDSKEQAISEAIAEYGLDYEVVYVGKIKDIDVLVNVPMIFDQLAEDAYEQAGEYAEDFLTDVKTPHLHILQDRFNTVLKLWMEEFNYNPNFWTVVNVEMIDVNKYDNINESWND